MTIHSYKVTMDEETVCRCGKEVLEGDTAFEILDEYTVSIACGLCSRPCVKAEVAAIKADAAKPSLFTWPPAVAPAGNQSRKEWQQ